MCARAMANMGLEHLVLVGAPDVTDEMKQGAAHAQDVLRNAARYATHADFMAAEGDGLRIALSGKDARLKAPDWLDDTLDSFRAEGAEHLFADASLPIYLIFGPEDDGLAADEMEFCHHMCRLPTFGEITSLNISHAVLLTCYMVQTALGRRASDAPSTAAAVTIAPSYYPSETIRNWLTALGFDISSRRINIEKTLNRIFLSHSPSTEELKIVDSVLQQTVRKLRPPK